MEPDLQHLGEELITTAARLVRWVPKDGFHVSLAAARLLARLHDNGPTRISELAVAERCSQPTITNHVKRLEAAQLVTRRVDPHDGRAWIITLTGPGEDELTAIRTALGVSLEPYLARLTDHDRRALADAVAVLHRLMTTPEPEETRP